MSSLSVIFGHIGDMLSARRTPFILSLILNFFFTLALALSTDIWMLLVARLLQGLSTAIVTTFGSTLLTEVVEREYLGRAMGYTNMAFTLGLLLGPVVGGLLYDYCGYFQVYLPAFALLGLEIVLRLMMIEKKKPSSSMGRAPPVAETARRTQSTPPTNNNAFAKVRSKESEPLLHSTPRSQSVNAYWILLSSPQFLVALIGLFILNSIACGFDSTVTPFIHDSFGMRATHAAILFLALAVPMLLAPLAGWISDQYGPKLPIAAGLLLAALSLASLAFITESTHFPFLKMAVLLAIVGFAFTLALTPLRVEASLEVDRMERESPGRFGRNGANGRAFGLMNSMVAAGGLVGPLYAGFMRVAAGWEALAYTNGAVCAVVLVLVVVITGNSKQ